MGFFTPQAGGGYTYRGNRVTLNPVDKEVTNGSSNMVVLALLCVFFLVVGIVALWWPEKIQEYGLHYYANAKGMARWNPFAKWMRSCNYVLSLRIVGALAIFVAFVALCTLIKKT